MQHNDLVGEAAPVGYNNFYQGTELVGEDSRREWRYRGGGAGRSSTRQRAEHLERDEGAGRNDRRREACRADLRCDRSGDVL